MLSRSGRSITTLRNEPPTNAACTSFVNGSARRTIPPVFFFLADEAAKLTDDYNREAEEHLRILNSEKQSALGVMIEGFIKICAESETAAQNLRFIERELGGKHPGCRTFES